MQFLNSLITGFFLVAMSTPVAYYGYFLTREYIHPNYVEKMERGILDEKRVAAESLIRNPPLKGQEPNIYRVKEIITNNNKLYKKKNISFKQIDILKDKLPKYDLMICRDCLMHFSNEDIFKSFINFSNSSIKYLLTTSHLENKKGKFKNIKNKDIVTGGFRFLDLFSKPFNLNKKVLYTIDDCEFEIGKKIKSKMYLFTKQDIKKKLRANKKL